MLTMKLLIASVNHEHPNTMHINYYHSLAEVAEVEFYGPGFSTREELEKGINRFVDKKGPFDAIILAFPLIMSSLKVSSIRDIYRNHRYFLSDYSVNQAVQYSDRIIEDIIKMDTIKILLYGQDIINICSEWQECLKDMLENGFYVMAPGREFIPELEEKEGQTFGEGLMLNNRFKRLLEQYPEQSISIPFHAAVCGEYFFGALQNRTYDCVVPGNIDGCYSMRGQIIQKLKQAGYQMYEEFIDRNMAYKVGAVRGERVDYAREDEQYVDSKLGKGSPYIKNNLKREEVARWRENYRVSLRSSKIAYADGGEGHMLVRKYIEIPACGTLLICENILGLDRLGFMDGKNMVAVTIKNVVDICMDLFENLEKMQQIASDGRRLVLTKHTSRHRAENTIGVIQEIMHGNYMGSYWERGEFVIKKRKR